MRLSTCGTEVSCALAVWPLPDIAVVTAPDDVPKVSVVLARPGAVGLNVIGTVIDCPVAKVTGSGVDGAPVLNTALLDATLVTVTGRSAVIRVISFLRASPNASKLAPAFMPIVNPIAGSPLYLNKAVGGSV